MGRRDDFRRLYHEAWNKVRLNPEPVMIEDGEAEFTPAEFLNVRQRVALQWMYGYVANNQRLKSLFWSMSGSDTRRQVVQAAEAKYGPNSGACIVVTETINI